MVCCKHRNCEISRYDLVETCLTFEDGMPKWRYDRGIAIYGEKIVVSCHDCGLHETYTYKTIPQWIKDYLNAFALQGWG